MPRVCHLKARAQLGLASGAAGHKRQRPGSFRLGAGGWAARDRAMGNPEMSVESTVILTWASHGQCGLDGFMRVLHPVSRQWDPVSVVEPPGLIGTRQVPSCRSLDMRAQQGGWHAGVLGGNEVLEQELSSFSPWPVERGTHWKAHAGRSSKNEESCPNGRDSAPWLCEISIDLMKKH